MADLFKSLKHTADPSRSGFDLSRKHVFSTKVGQAVPCLCVETVPGDHFEIDLASLTRTETFSTAAFLRGKQNFDFFFVPYSQLWHPFNQFISQRTDKHSSLQKSHIYCPVVRLDKLLIFVWNLVQDNSYKDIHGFSLGLNAIRLLDLLGYGDFRWIIDIDDLDTFNVQIQPYADKYVNIFRFAAYQHIWYDFYRNKYWDVESQNYDGLTSTFSSYVDMFNFDDTDCSTFANSEIIVPNELDSDQDTYRWLNILSMRYVQWKKDLFTSAMPSQQFGAVSSVDISGVNILSDAELIDNGSVTVNSASSNYQKLFVSTSISSSDSTLRHSWTIPSAFDVLSLRKAEALQQWKQNTLRGGNMTDDAFKSHYGVEPYYEGDENVRYLGSFSSSLQVNAVEATASTGVGSNNNVGDLAATGTIVCNGNKLSVDCKDFGVIMCISNYRPENEYSSNAIDKANTLFEQFDFFTPEFQNIGLEPVQIYQEDMSNIGDQNFDLILGYAPRYYMYKTAVDRIFGEFKQTESLSGTVTAYGTLSHWAAPRVDEFSSTEQTTRLLSSFYVDPHVYDSVSSLEANNYQITDFFIHNVFFDIKAIRPMTVLGLPQF